MPLNYFIKGCKPVSSEQTGNWKNNNKIKLQKRKGIG